VTNVGTLVPAGLAVALRKAPLCDEKVGLAWRLAVGPAIDLATTARLVEGVLQVSVERPEWQREIRRSAALIRSRLETVLGQGSVRSLKVSGGGDEGAARPRRSRPARPSRSR
jgi:hypothetical protein